MIDIAAFEAWLEGPAKADAVRWRLAGLDLWPLLNTCIGSLAIQIATGQRRGPVVIGSPAWQAAVAADRALQPLRRLAARRRTTDVALPPDRLDGLIVYAASRIHTRTLGGVLVTAPLDVPAMLMRRAGHEGVLWLDDAPAAAPELALTLACEARGLADLLAAARADARHEGVAGGLRRLAGFPGWCAAAAGQLGLAPAFLRHWLARQVALAAAAQRAFGGLFDARGRPSLVVMLNGGFAVTTGLVHAARARGVRVAEVQHGARSRGAAIAPGAEPHFASFDTGPDRYIGWETSPAADPASLSVGPIGLHLAAVVGATHARDRPAEQQLRAWLARERDDLARLAAGARREVLVSLQPGDDGQWVAELAGATGKGTHFWVRRHGADRNRPLGQAITATVNAETTLAGSATLSLLLERVDVHVTRFSAVTLEAAACGVPTLAVEPYAATLYRERVPPHLLTLATERSTLGERLALMTADAEPAASRGGSRRRPGATGDHPAGGLPDCGAIVPFLETAMARR